MTTTVTYRCSRPDLTSAELAIALKADHLLLPTDVPAVPAVMTDFGMPDAAPLCQLDLAQLDQVTFPAGSMGPKIEACRRFVQATGATAAIGALTDAEAILHGDAGTAVHRYSGAQHGDPRTAPKT